MLYTLPSCHVLATNDPFNYVRLLGQISLHCSALNTIPFKINFSTSRVCSCLSTFHLSHTGPSCNLSSLLGLWSKAHSALFLNSCISSLHRCSFAFHLFLLLAFLYLSLLCDHCGLRSLGFQLHSLLICLLRHSSFLLFDHFCLLTSMSLPPGTPYGPWFTLIQPSGHLESSYGIF